MLREPHKAKKAVELKKDKQTGRFQIVKLEERIAPVIAPGPGQGWKHGNNCHTNPHGKLVGC